MDLFRQGTTKIIIKSRVFLQKEGKVLLIIFVLGLVLRLLGLLNITFAGDNLLHWKIAGEIVNKGMIPLLGPRASLTGDFNLGPFYYYLLAVPYWLGGGNFKMAVIFFAVLNSLSIPLLYVVAKRWFSKLQSFKISLLFACSTYFIQIQSFPWNPYVLPLFIIISLYFIAKIRERKYFYFIFLSISYAICLQLHATAIFLLPILVYLLPLRKIPLKHYFSGLILLLIANSPWIWVNFTTNFSQIKAAELILSSGKIEQCSLIAWLSNHGNGERCFWYFRNTLFAFRFLNTSLFDSNNVLLAIASLILVSLYFIKTKLKENRYLFVWLFAPIFLYLFYSNSIYLHYFLILTPVPFFLLILFLGKVEKKGRNWTLAANCLYLLVIVINLCQYVWSLQFVRG
jgi:4-amino-4-deoxy-L-arabinose transferase-like glycosyltransferase